MNQQSNPQRDQEGNPNSLLALAMECDRKGHSPDLTIHILEKEGASLDLMIAWAETYFVRSRETESHFPAFENPRTSALLLVFGCSPKWEDMKGEVLRLGSELYRQMLVRDPGFIQAIRRSLSPVSFKRFRNRVLARLGMPLHLAHSLKNPGVAHPAKEDVLSWITSGRPLVGFTVLLEGFEGAGNPWGHIHVPKFTLRNGRLPEVLSWGSGPICYSRASEVSELNLDQISGLRELRVDHFGLSPSDLNGRAEGRVVLKACSDLERIEGAFLDLRLESCPNLKSFGLGLGTRSLLLHDCPNVRELRGWELKPWEATARGECPLLQIEELTISRCGGLKRLPPRLRVVRDFRLSDSGALEDWPWDLHVGGDLLIDNCPGFRSLPPMEVKGSLRISGFSRLRDLQAGTIIHGDLDLRACDQLTGIPAGLRVAGRILLPDHLETTPQAAEVGRFDFLELRERSHGALGDHVRKLLLGFKFLYLVPGPDRAGIHEEALESLRQVRTYLFRESTNESVVLWAAEEAWRELSEADWAKDRPWLEGANESDEELPTAWFLNLVDPMRSNCYDRE
jgi:hypothetical protein